MKEEKRDIENVLTDLPTCESAWRLPHLSPELAWKTLKALSEFYGIVRFLGWLIDLATSLLA